MSEEKKIGQIFKELNAVNVTENTKTKNDLTYLPWAKAWERLCKIVPDAIYEIKKNEANLPYFASELGIMVYTEMTIAGITREMWLPVMDSANRSLKMTPYTVEKKDRNGKPYSVQVAAATMNDINKTIMRCLTKNIAMYGMGLHVYNGEDITSDEREQLEKYEYNRGYETLMRQIRGAVSPNELQYIYDAYPQYNKDGELMNAMKESLHNMIEKCKELKEVVAVYNGSKWAQTMAELTDWCGKKRREIEKVES